MKYVLIFTIIFFSTLSHAQRLDEYTASNGITYKEGDTVKLGLGSGMQGTFVHLKMGGWITGTAEIGSAYSNMAVEIKKIKKVKMKGAEQVYFVVGGGNITNYNLMIEPAIETCEVKPCKEEISNTINSSDKYDKLAKIKELLDQGVLTEEEYEIEKEKILKQ